MRTGIRRQIDLQEVRLIAEKFADDGFGKGAAVAGIVGLMAGGAAASAGNARQGVGLFAGKFAGLGEWAFLSHADATMEEVQRLVDILRIRRRWRAVSPGQAQNAPIGPWSGRLDLAAAGSLKDCARIQWSVNSSRSTKSVISPRISGVRSFWNGEADGGKVEDMADLDPFAVFVESVPHALVWLVKGQDGGEQMAGPGAQFFRARCVSLRFLDFRDAAHHPDIGGVKGGTSWI